MRGAINTVLHHLDTFLQINQTIFTSCQECLESPDGTHDKRKYFELAFQTSITNDLLHLVLFITILTPTSNSLTQKYIRFIRSTFTSVDTQPFASKGILYRQQTTFNTILLYSRDSKISMRQGIPFAEMKFYYS